MSEPTLFDSIDSPGEKKEDQKVAEERDAKTTKSPDDFFDSESDISVAPKAKTHVSSEHAGKLSPIEYLLHILEETSGEGQELKFHPRTDKMWIVKKGPMYALNVKKGRHEYLMTAEATRQLASLLDVPVKLLERLAALPRVEDSRLLNMLLWAEGARPDAYFWFLLKNDKIVAAHSGGFSTITHRELAERLKEKEDQGELKVRWNQLEGSTLWVEIEHPNMEQVDLKPKNAPEHFNPDWWTPGAVLMSQETGGKAITTFPALFRGWGGSVLPVITSKSDIKKHRHSQSSKEELLKGIVRDVISTRESAFQEVGNRLRALHDQFIPDKGVHAYVEGLGMPFPTQGSRDGVVRKLVAGRASLYRLVTAVLTESKKLKDLSKRQKLEIATGRFVWSRGGSRSVRKRKKKRS